MPQQAHSEGAALERAAAAPLQASGWFVIRGAADPSFGAFELDVLGYRIADERLTSVVVESKSGRSAFGDLWKLLGLKTHLEIDRGVLLASPSDPLHEQKVDIGSLHDVAVINQAPRELADAYVDAGLIELPPPTKILDAWRLCFEVEDGLLRVLHDKHLWHRYETIRIAKRQVQHLATSAWIEPDPWRQAAELYELYSATPKIALKMAKEVMPEDPDRAFREAMYDGKHEEIQACFYLEHRKRLAVAFAATRCAALGKRPGMFGPHTPAAFNELVQQVRDRRAWELPQVLQLYVHGFGGLICLDATDAEHEALAAQATCTAAEVPDLVSMFDELFPYPNGGTWFLDRDDMQRLKLMPVCIRAAGLRMREALYGLPWDEVATREQRRACGADHFEAAEQMRNR